MQKSKYIPGFDWVKIFGSILVMLFHFGVLSFFHEENSTLSSMLKTLVPGFFIISGYLSGRNFSKQRIKKQVIRYGTIYMAIEACVVLYARVKDIWLYGRFRYVNFIVKTLKCLVIHNSHTYQLWFIPPLLYSLIINAYLDGKKRRILIFVIAALKTFLTVTNNGFLLYLSEKLFAVFPLLTRIATVSEVNKAFENFLAGLLFTTLGFELANTKLKAKTVFFVSLPFCAFDLWVRYTGISMILLSILFFLLIKKLPGDFLFPYHMEISLFAGIMFFLHVSEKHWLSLISQNKPLNIVIIIVFNLLLTVLVSVLIRRKKGKTNEFLPNAGTDSQ